MTSDCVACKKSRYGEIREMHPLLTPKLTSATIGRAVKDYYNGNPRLKREVIKLFGKIENWDVSNDWGKVEPVIPILNLSQWMAMQGAWRG